MLFTNLPDWLHWLNQLHPTEIELGITRTQTVAHRMGLKNLPFPIITIAGTNGKGSSVAMLNAILTAQHYRTGCYTSPHLLHFNERICFNQQPATDEQLCTAFNAVETARHNTSLTYFEFTTLAAIWLFQQTTIDIAILEVGMGGRLDAVNVFDPTIALITTIDLDHQAWLGNTREQIGYEKAGIFRPKQPAVINDPNPPQSILNHAEQLKTTLYRYNQDYHYTQTEQTWQWQTHTKQYDKLPLPNLHGNFQLNNAAGILMVLELLQPTIPTNENAIKKGLQNIQLPARFQIIPKPVTRIFDVAHNPQSAQALAHLLQQHPCPGKTHAIVNILKDKDITQILQPLTPHIHTWHIAKLNTNRSSETHTLRTTLNQLNIHNITEYDTISNAYQTLTHTLQPPDRIIVFGSFYTVAEAMQTELTNK